MATIRMKKGDVYADIYDSPETIETAKNEGFREVVDEKPAKVEKVVENDNEVKPVVHKKTTPRK